MRKLIIVAKGRALAAPPTGTGLIHKGTLEDAARGHKKPASDFADLDDLFGENLKEIEKKSRETTDDHPYHGGVKAVGFKKISEVMVDAFERKGFKHEGTVRIGKDHWDKLCSAEGEKLLMNTKPTTNGGVVQVVHRIPSRNVYPGR